KARRSFLEADGTTLVRIPRRTDRLMPQAAQRAAGNRAGGHDVREIPPHHARGAELQVAVGGGARPAVATEPGAADGVPGDHAGPGEREGLHHDRLRRRAAYAGPTLAFQCCPGPAPGAFLPLSR